MIYIFYDNALFLTSWVLIYESADESYNLIW